MDGFFGIGFLELALVAIIALIVLGPERMPGIMREGARYLRELRKLGREFSAQFSDELKALDEINPRRILNEMTDPLRPEQETKTPAAKGAAPGKPLSSAAPSRSAIPAPTARPSAPAIRANAQAAANGAPVADPVPSSEAATEPVTDNSILPPAPAPAQAVDAAAAPGDGSSQA